MKLAQVFSILGVIIGLCMYSCFRLNEKTDLEVSRDEAILNIRIDKSVSVDATSGQRSPPPGQTAFCTAGARAATRPDVDAGGRCMLTTLSVSLLPRWQTPKDHHRHHQRTETSYSVPSIRSSRTSMRSSPNGTTTSARSVANVWGRCAS